jgi:hypothetical protein
MIQALLTGWFAKLSNQYDEIWRRTMSGIYRIRIKGPIEPNWAAEFEGLSLRHLVDSKTLLHGAVDELATKTACLILAT